MDRIARAKFEHNISLEEVTRDRPLEEVLMKLPGVRRATVEVQGNSIKSVKALILPEYDADTVMSAVESELVGHDLEVPADLIKIWGSEHHEEGGSVPRRRFASLMLKRLDDVFQSQVALRLNGDALLGEASSPDAEGIGLQSELETVSRATLDALTMLLKADAEIQSVRVIDDGPDRLVLVKIKLRDERLVGCVLVKKGEHDAVVRAILDALNRALVGYSPA